MRQFKTFFILVALTLGFLSSSAQNQNISNGFVFDGEPYLSVNPNNSQHLVVAWMSWIDFIEEFKIKVRTSFDGGQTWSAPITLDHTQTAYTSADPSIAFDENGNVLICYIDFTGTEPPCTGGVYICTSTDGGLSFGSPAEVITTDYDGTKWPIDRPWMVIDRSSGPNQGNIYVTSFNLNRNEPSYNPYLSVSSDGGNSFSHRYLDTLGWLAGSLNPLPVCSPTLSSSGVFHGVYPSYVLSQSLYFQSFLASSSDGGVTVDHKLVQGQSTPANSIDYPDAKKAGLLLSDPSSSNHLVYVFLSTQHGDPDIFLIETYDEGTNWTAPVRLNDDPVGNNRIQDMLWGDFDVDGSLVVSWRDRRNGSDSTYQTSSEIWAAYRNTDSTAFSSNFQITDQTVDYDTILASAGNDFMCIKLQDDTLNAVWGDVRNGRLNIWFQRMATDGTTLSVTQLATDRIPEITIYPNPTVSLIHIKAKDLLEARIFDLKGSQLLSVSNENGTHSMKMNLESLPNGTYILEAETKFGTARKEVLKQ